MHILLILLINCDAYVQKIQNYCTEKTKEKNRLVKQYETKNSIFKAKFLQDLNILNDIGAGVANLDRETFVVHTSQIRNTENTTASHLVEEREPSSPKVIEISKNHNDTSMLDKFYQVFRRIGQNEKYMIEYNSCVG